MTTGYSDRNDEPTPDRNYQLVDYCRDVEISLRENASWRAGQAYFNVLAEKRPDISERIRSTGVDPFHNNSAIPVFLHHVIAQW